MKSNEIINQLSQINELQLNNQLIKLNQIKSNYCIEMNELTN